MWHIWFMGLAAPIFAGKSHTGQKSSLSSSKCTQSWQKLLSAPHHTWKSLTLLASTEAEPLVIFKTQTSHLPQKKSQEVKPSRVISPFCVGFSAEHWVSVGFSPEIQVWRHWQPPLSAEPWPTEFSIRAGKTWLHTQSKHKAPAEFSTFIKKNAQPEEIKTPGFTSHWF